MLVLGAHTLAAPEMVEIHPTPDRLEGVKLPMHDAHVFKRVLTAHAIGIPKQYCEWLLKFWGCFSDQSTQSLSDMVRCFRTVCNSKETLAVGSTRRRKTKWSDICSKKVISRLIFWEHPDDIDNILFENTIPKKIISFNKAIQLFDKEFIRYKDLTYPRRYGDISVNLLENVMGIEC